RGNVVNPDEQVAEYGADTVRCYLMFIGPWSEGGPFQMTGIKGISRWLNAVWTLAQEEGPSAAGDEGSTRELQRLMHKTIKRVGDDLEAMRFNTMVAALMEYVNGLRQFRERGVDADTWNRALDALLLLLAPSAPHLTEELWQRRGRPYSIHQQAWPEYDAALAADEVVTVAVQVNGKLRDRVTVPAGSDETALREAALASERVRAYTEGHEIARVIAVPGRLVNIQVR